MDSKRYCQAIWRYNTESKNPEIIFSALEHLNKQPRRELLLQKKKNPKSRGDLSKRLGRAQTKSCLLPMGSPSFHPEPASSMTQYKNMFANVSFVVHVWITRTETMKLLVVANYHFQGLFYTFKVIKKFHQPFSTIWVGNEQSHTKTTSKHKFILKSTQEPSTSTSFLSSAGNFWEATKHPK